jgi:hypothetical protein
VQIFSVMTSKGDTVVQGPGCSSSSKSTYRDCDTDKGRREQDEDFGGLTAEEAREAKVAMNALLKEFEDVFPDKLRPDFHRYGEWTDIRSRRSQVRHRVDGMVRG